MTNMITADITNARDTSCMLSLDEVMLDKFLESVQNERKLVNCNIFNFNFKTFKMMVVP